MLKTPIISSFILVACLMLIGCSPKIPAAFNQLPDELKFEHNMIHLTSDYTGAISLNHSRNRHNLSDDELLAFQQVMEESEFFNHTKVYDDVFPALFNTRDFYYPDGQIWVKREGFSMHGETFTSIFTPVVFNNQPDAIFTDPREIPFYAPFLSGESPEPGQVTIDYVKYSSIPKKPKRYLTDNYRNGRHHQNKPYRIVLFPSEFNVIHREEILIDYWKLSELFEKVWQQEFEIHVTDEETASPVAGAELVIHHFLHEDTRYGRFAFFSEVVSESPFARRYRAMFNRGDASGLVSHYLHSEDDGIIRLMVPLHPDRPAPLLNFSISADGYSAITKDEVLSGENIAIGLRKE